MKHDATIAVRFLTPEEAGRKSFIPKGIYSCPMIVEGADNAFDCRTELLAQLELGNWACLPVQFLSPDEALAFIKPGQKVELREGKLVAKGIVVEARNQKAIHSTS